MAITTLAAYTDGNHWLDPNKAAFSGAGDADFIAAASNGDNIVKGYLGALFTNTVVNNWTNAATAPEEETPKLVKEIASMLYASYHYSKVYSELTEAESNYAKTLEARAMDLLKKLQTGEISLTDVTYESGTVFEAADFWPNDTTVDENQVIPGNAATDPLRFARMDKVF